MNSDHDLETLVSLIHLEAHLNEGIKYATEAYCGWPGESEQIIWLNYRLDSAQKKIVELIDKHGHGIYVAAVEQAYDA